MRNSTIIKELKNDILYLKQQNKKNFINKFNNRDINNEIQKLRQTRVDQHYDNNISKCLGNLLSNSNSISDEDNLRVLKYLKTIVFNFNSYINTSYPMITNIKESKNINTNIKESKNIDINKRQFVSYVNNSNNSENTYNKRRRLETIAQQKYLKYKKKYLDLQAEMRKLNLI
jgi:hypothetical protein